MKGFAVLRGSGALVMNQSVGAMSYQQADPPSSSSLGQLGYARLYWLSFTTQIVGTAKVWINFDGVSTCALCMSCSPYLRHVQELPPDRFFEVKSVSGLPKPRS